MSEETTEQEPSIEEILSSIRQIISDDEEGEPEAETPPGPVDLSPPEEEPEPELQVPADDVLELTEKVEDEPLFEPEPEPEPESVGMEIELRDSDEPEPEAEPLMVRPDDGDSLLTERAEGAALEGFARLTGQVPVNRAGNAGITLEDIVREQMHPMLRDWLDENLPTMIEKLVQRELDRLANKVQDD